MKKTLGSLLAALGYQIVKIGRIGSVQGTMESALASLGRRLEIKSVIDVGASNGIWSRLAMNFFPEARYLLIEANPAYKAALNEFVMEQENAQFTLAAAGETQGGLVNFSFDPADPYGGQASNMTQAGSMSIPVVTIDGEVTARSLEGPYLIKLDTHGFEVPIFRGAAGTLSHTEAIIVECYNFKISSESLLFHEMCALLDTLGFRCIDVVDPLWRPLDRAFWQMDMVFVRKDRPEFSNPAYR